MKKFLIGCIAIILNTTFFYSYSFAGAEIFPAKSFKKVQETVIKMGAANYPHTLVVMDDDDTLTMMRCPDKSDCQYLGGPAWYSWQNDLLDNEKEKHFEVAKNSRDLLDISALLLSINYMWYTEEIIPDVLHSLTESGVKLLVLTARGSSNLSATENQFSNLSVKKKKDKPENFLEFISQHALKGNKSGITSIAGPFKPKECKAVRPVSYQQGVMYVAGQNKGAMLKCLLDRTDSSQIKNIVFIDDTLANVEDVYTAFESSRKYNVKAIHYIALEEHKKALTKGPKAKELQKNATKRWDAIKQTLEKQLLTPAIP